MQIFLEHNSNSKIAICRAVRWTIDTFLKRSLGERGEKVREGIFNEVQRKLILPGVDTQLEDNKKRIKETDTHRPQ